MTMKSKDYISHYREVQKKIPEFAKSPYRNEIINYLLSIKKNET